MEDFSFTVDDTSYSRGRSPLRGHHTTPATSTSTSRSPRPRRRSRRPSSDDMSWQSSVSWQFEPTGWREPGGFGAALSPWTPPSTTSRPNRSPAIFLRSAKDYYLSRTSNPVYEQSREGGRLELRSHVSGARHRSRELGRPTPDASPSSGFTMRAFRGRGGQASTAGTDTSLASLDELSMVDFSEPELIAPRNSLHYSTRIDHTSNRHQRHDHSLDISFSRDDHTDHLYISPMKCHDQDASLSHGGSAHGDGQGHRVHGMHEYDDDDDGYGDEDEEEEEEEEEERISPPVGLLSLFKYSTTWDLVLVFLGCIGALINGGSLPWYSFLFGDFVNKIALESIKDKAQMMKDVQTVSNAA